MNDIAHRFSRFIPLSSSKVVIKLLLVRLYFYKGTRYNQSRLRRYVQLLLRRYEKHTALRYRNGFAIYGE